MNTAIGVLNKRIIKQKDAGNMNGVYSSTAILLVGEQEMAILHDSLDDTPKAVESLIEGVVRVPTVYMGHEVVHVCRDTCLKLIQV